MLKQRLDASLAAIFAIVAFATSASCGNTRGVPRVDPELHNWEAPYQGANGLRLHVFNTGSMTIPEAAVFHGGNWFSRRRLDVPAFVVETEGLGLIVFDTGLSTEVRDDPRGYLGFVAPTLNGLAMPAGAELPAQMKAAGLDPAQVRYVVLSHLHFDHTGSIHAFPNAAIVTGHGERDEASATSGFFDFFMEGDWEGTARWIEIDYSAGEPYATFRSHHDLNGDGAVILVDLHGHTRGSQGMLLRAPEGPIGTRSRASTTAGTPRGWTRAGSTRARRSRPPTWTPGGIRSGASRSWPRSYRSYWSWRAMTSLAWRGRRAPISWCTRRRGENGDAVHSPSDCPWENSTQFPSGSLTMQK